MNKKNSRNYPEDGFPDLKTGIQKWEILTMVGSLFVIGFLMYLILFMD